MEFENVIRNRCSIRSFQSKQVEEEKLNKILEAGNLAPSAKNLQPLKIIVIESEKYLEKIREASPCTYNAQTVLLVCASKEEAFNKGDFSTYEMDASIATTHMMLEATNLGVDSVWVELFDADKIKESFPLEEGYSPICLLPLGYRTEDAEISPNHYKRKRLEEIVSRI